MPSYTRFRANRTIRRYRRDAAKIRVDVTDYARQHLYGKWRQLAMIRRFAAGWWLLILLVGVGLVVQVERLRQNTLFIQPLAGGTYTEALAGTIKNVNPILPEGSASADVTRLVFDGLTRYNASGQVEPDLASSWAISDDGRTYTFKLRKGVKWHDGVPFSSADVAFTLAAVQNPDTRSPLNLSWKGVKVQTPDDLTVQLILPKPFTPFLTTTTIGIIPRHLLENSEPSQLRVASFNQHPVGTGPFKLDQLDPSASQVELKANSAYWGKKPLLDSITFKTYSTSEQAYDALIKRQVMGVNKAPRDKASEARELASLHASELTTPDEVGVFLKNSAPMLQDKAVREALAKATNRGDLIKEALGGEATPVASPLLPTELAIKGVAHQPRFDLKGAESELEAAGWKKQPDGTRKKQDQVLQLNLVTQSDSTYGAVATAIKNQWAKVGVRVHVVEVDPTTLQQSFIRPRKYDALLYGINVGADPDVYAFWHSSQAADPGLNLSAYKSPAVDKALEGGRTVREPGLRAAKYKAFAQAWVADTPAVMLYSPNYLYAQNKEVYGFSTKHLITPSDRFYGVEHWAVRTKLIGQ
ncbi:MAG TPA: peptide ABC transporter substrate-binding protein [Candidatus Saccharimonadales bacterium]|nr:peptide ABC transporter substrate-binding protein [Candidatus Saccharimonadales bacterium]